MALQAKEIERAANTVIGESILINGKLEGDEDLTVRGRVHGSITLTKTLIVEPSGGIKADATVRNAVISGVVVGNITASESVHLTKEGRMVGDIKAPRVIIVEGAAFRGRVDMGDLDKLAPRPRPVAQTTPAPSRAAVKPAGAPPRPPAPPAKPSAVVKAAPARPADAGRPPAPPPAPPAIKPMGEGPAASLAMALAKKKVVVKRKK